MYERVTSNVRRSWILMIGFVAFVALIGWVFGELTGWGLYGLLGALVLALVMTWASYLRSDRIALAISRARPAEGSQFLQLHNVVEALSLAAGIPKPGVYVIDDIAPNAFATGRDPEHAAVAVTTGLLDKMGRDELEGVIAHELSHVKNRDILVMTLAVTLVGVIVLLSDWLMRAMWYGRGRGRNRYGAGGIPLAVAGLLLIVTAPLIAQVMQFAISRRREFLADADAVLLTRYPPGLISALERLRDDETVVSSASKATAHLWIESPLQSHAHAGEKGASRPGAWVNRLFNTHPTLEDRIDALERSALGRPQ